MTRSNINRFKNFNFHERRGSTIDVIDTGVLHCGNNAKLEDYWLGKDTSGRHEGKYYNRDNIKHYKRV